MPNDQHPKLSRRKFCGMVGGALAFPGIVRGAATGRIPKVAVVGADGMDPTLLHLYASQGLLPNCRKLIDSGGFKKLRTTLPPQSPVAWATFISGLDPGGHGIYDFISRDAGTVAADLATAKTTVPKRFVRLGRYSVPLASSKLQLMRNGPTLWHVLHEAGVPSVALKAPVNYPPTPTGAKTLSGLTTPDIHGSYGIFSFYSTDPKQATRDVPGGQIEKIRLARGLAYCVLRGPANVFDRERPSADIPFTIERDPQNAVARIRIQGRDVILNEREWSGWVPLNFPLMPYVADVPAMCRFFLKQVRPQLELYVSPVNIDPVNPAFPVSTPKDFSRQLVDEVGRFYTQGMAEETPALSSGVLSDAEFRQHALHVLDEDIRIFRSQLNHYHDGFFFAYFSSLDMNSHMFWRTVDEKHPLYTPALAREHGDHLPALYRRIDAFVGDVVEHLAPDGQIYIVSDHAFTSFRRQFNLNAWLLDHGYAGLKNRLDRDGAPDFKNTDWTRTRAYGLGINSLFLNLQSREPDGVVKAGDEAERLRTELIAALTAIRDPQTGEQVIRRVVRPDQVYRHTSGGRVPDLVICYNDNYRASWDTILGGYPKEHLLDNLDPWSGDHCMDPQFLSGVLLTNAPVRHSDPALEDLAPTIISAFGVSVPGEMKGRDLRSESVTAR